MSLNIVVFYILFIPGIREKDFACLLLYVYFLYDLYDFFI